MSVYDGEEDAGITAHTPITAVHDMSRSPTHSGVRVGAMLGTSYLVLHPENEHSKVHYQRGTMLTPKDIITAARNQPGTALSQGAADSGP